MARTGGPLTRCGGRWTEAKFNSFVKNNLRSASRKWPPISDCLRKARIGRGLYKCEGCGEEVTATIFDEDKGKRVKGIVVDHIKPIIDPAVGFTTWDDCINGMYCEPDNLQALCNKCHKEKSQDEINIAKARRAAAKEEVLEDDE